jgi:hypothetical protein
VTYHTNTKDEVVVSADTMGYGYGPECTGVAAWATDHHGALHTYTKGTLVVDVWDAREKPPLPGLGNRHSGREPEKLEKKINKIVEKMVKEFDKKLEKENKKKATEAACHGRENGNGPSECGLPAWGGEAVPAREAEH